MARFALMAFARAAARSLAMAAAAAACNLAAAAGTPFSVAPCDFKAPDQWGEYSVRWAGTCANGKAEGLGVLRAYRDGQVQQIYFGRFVQGEPSFGVIDHPEGFIAGRFKNGKLVDNEERQDVISAFRAGEAAALAFAQQLKRNGNASSARFYQEKAHKLATQME
ncbi:hypothetical protein [Massilia aerilata]|uniref:Toxin-antitoxin system YwqK family antitoxin n=1 Tax=Massilia aerilata TaxID=453817 RepID=A0ABW0RTU9_9BURK